jgi:hypothetical protein
MFLAILLIFLQAVSDRTPHTATSPTPYGGNDYSAPNIWLYVVGVIVVLFIIGLFVGFKNPFKRKF